MQSPNRYRMTWFILMDNTLYFDKLCCPIVKQDVLNICKPLFFSSHGQISYFCFLRVFRDTFFFLIRNAKVGVHHLSQHYKICLSVSKSIIKNIFIILLFLSLMMSLNRLFMMLKIFLIFIMLFIYSEIININLMYLFIELIKIIPLL